MSNECVYAIPLKNNEEIRMSMKEFKGDVYCDFRVYFESKEDSSKYPSKKGLTIRKGIMDEFAKGVVLMQKTIQKGA